MSFTPCKFPQFSLVKKLEEIFGNEIGKVDFIKFSTRAIELCTDDKIKAILYNDLAIFTKKEEHFFESIQLDPSNEDYWNSLGIFYVSSNQLIAAQKCFRIIIERNPKTVACWVNLGFVAILLKQPANALKYFEEAQRLAPLDPLPWIGQFLVG